MVMVSRFASNAVVAVEIYSYPGVFTGPARSVGNRYIGNLGADDLRLPLDGHAGSADTGCRYTCRESSIGAGEIGKCPPYRMGAVTM